MIILKFLLCVFAGVIYYLWHLRLTSLTEDASIRKLRFYIFVSFISIVIITLAFQIISIENHLNFYLFFLFIFSIAISHSFGRISLNEIEMEMDYPEKVKKFFNAIFKFFFIKAWPIILFIGLCIRIFQ